MMTLISTSRRLNVVQRMASHQTIFVNQQQTLMSATPSTSPVDEVEKTPPKPFHTIPGPRGIYNIPFLGFLFHMKPFGDYTPGTMHHLFDDLIKRYGTIFKIRTDVPTVVLTDAKDFAAMQRKEGKFPFRPHFEIFNVYYKRTGAKHTVMSLQGQDWWTLRAPKQKAVLRPKEISKYLPMMNQVADDFIRMLLDGYLTDHGAEETFMFYMAESVCTAFFNKRIGFLEKNQSEESKRLQEALTDLFDIFLKTLLGSSVAFQFYKSKDYQTFANAMDCVRQATTRYIREAVEETKRQKELGTFDPEQPNMLESLLKDVSEENLNPIIEGLFFAAIDSSASALQIVLHRLAKHQDVQNKLREEVQAVLGDSDSNVQVTQELLNQMPYLKACVKEVHRLDRIAPFGPVRILSEDIELGGYTIPAGVQIYNYNARSCRDETIFENPQNYEPERWLRQSGKGDSDSSWAVLPFGLGPRGCPGRRLFEQELYLLLAKLIQKARIGLEPDSLDVEFEYRLFLTPVKPIKFTFAPVHTKERQEQ